MGAAGNREVITEADGTTRTYGYDNLYRLTLETVTDALSSLVYEKTFVYDDVGNRDTQTTTGLDAQSINYTYDTRDRLLTENGTTYGYDDNGNLTTKSGDATYTWDVEDRLLRVDKNDGTLVEHVYDADGVRVRTETTLPGVGTTATNLLVDTSGPLSHVVAETDEFDGLVAYYVRGVGELLSVVRLTEQRYVHSDGLGSIRFLTDEAGAVTDSYEYTAFGETLRHDGTDQQPYQFAGEPFDPNVGFYYNRARWLDPSLGRFLGMDPFIGLFNDPATLHRYTYASLNPVNNVDPSGEFIANVSLTIGLLSGLAVTGLGLAFGVDVLTSVALGLAAGITAATFLPVAAFGATSTAVLYVTIARTASVGVAFQFFQLLRTVGTSTLAQVKPSIPPRPGNMSPKLFGELMRWGKDTDPQAPLRAVQQLPWKGFLDATKLNPPLTADMLLKWRQFYISVALNNPANPSAPGRAVLMEEASRIIK